jgi:hypothetical protein
MTQHVPPAKSQKRLLSSQQEQEMVWLFFSRHVRVAINYTEKFTMQIIDSDI